MLDTARRVNNPGVKLSRIIIESGLLRPDTLYSQVTKLTEDILKYQASQGSEQYKIQRRVLKQGEVIEIPRDSIGATVLFVDAGRYDYRVTWLEPNH